MANDVTKRDLMGKAEVYILEAYTAFHYADFKEEREGVSLLAKELMLLDMPPLPAPTSVSSADREDGERLAESALSRAWETYADAKAYSHARLIRDFEQSKLDHLRNIRRDRERWERAKARQAGKARELSEAQEGNHPEGGSEPKESSKPKAGNPPTKDSTPKEGHDQAEGSGPK